MIRLKKFIFLLGILILIPGILTGFGSSKEVQAASKVSINQTQGFLLPGETLQLSITGTSKKVTWSSDDKEIASVTNKGKVTAKNYGAATINAKVGKETYKCIIVVVDTSCIDIFSDSDAYTTNGAPIEVYADSFEYDFFIRDMEIDYKIVGNHKGKTVPKTKREAYVYSYEDGKFEVAASFHGKHIKSVKITSMKFPGLNTNSITLAAGETQAVHKDLTYPYYYPFLEDITVTSSDSSVAVAKPMQWANFRYNTVLGYFSIKALKAGTATISIKIVDTTHTLQVNVTGERQQPLYDPVQAVKLGKFNGYADNELKTLLYVYDFIHDYGLDSSDLSDMDRMAYVERLFYYFKMVNSYYKFNWASYGDISRVLLLFRELDSSISCAETVSFLLDCMEIPNYYCTGTYNGVSWAWNQVQVDGKWMYLDAAGYMIEERPSIISNDLWGGYQLDKKVKFSDQAIEGKDYFSLIG